MPTASGEMAMNSDHIEQFSYTSGSSGRNARLLNGSAGYELTDEVSLGPFSCETEESGAFLKWSRNKSDDTNLPQYFCTEVVDEFLPGDSINTKCQVNSLVKNPILNVRQILSIGRKETVLAENNNSEVKLDQDFEALGSWDCSEYSSEVKNSAVPCKRCNENTITVGFCESLHFLRPSEMNIRVEGSVSCDKSRDQLQEYSNLLKEGTLEHAFLGNVEKKRLLFQISSFKFDEAIQCVQVELSDGSEFSSNCIFGEDLTHQVETDINLWSIIEVLDYDIIADKFIKVKKFETRQKLGRMIGDPDPIEDGLFIKIHRGDFRVCTCISSQMPQSKVEIVNLPDTRKLDFEVSKRNRKSQNKFSLKENEDNSLSLSMGTKHEKLSIKYPSEENMIKDQMVNLPDTRKLNFEVAKRNRKSQNKFSLKENNEANGSFTLKGIKHKPHSEENMINKQISAKNNEMVFKKHLHLKTHTDADHNGMCYYCDQCLYVAKTKSSVQRHFESIHDGKRFKCDNCDWEAKSKWNLKVHVESIHDGKRFKCDECDYEAKSKWNLKLHIDTIHNVHNEKRFKCDECDYEAKRKWNLKVHVESFHNGIRYKCDDCDFQGTTKWNLKKHVETIHNGKHFKCDKCDYEAKSKWNLKVHVESFHYGIRYKCDNCDFQGTSKWNLKVHVESIHNGNCFKCEHCEYKTINSSYLEKHIIFRHKDIA